MKLSRQVRANCINFLFLRIVNCNKTWQYNVCSYPNGPRPCPDTLHGIHSTESRKSNANNQTSDWVLAVGTLVIYLKLIILRTTCWMHPPVHHPLGAQKIVLLRLKSGLLGLWWSRAICCFCPLRCTYLFGPHKAKQAMARPTPCAPFLQSISNSDVAQRVS